MRKDVSSEDTVQESVFKEWRTTLQLQFSLILRDNPGIWENRQGPPHKPICIYATTTSFSCLFILLLSVWVSITMLRDHIHSSISNIKCQKEGEISVIKIQRDSHLETEINTSYIIPETRPFCLGSSPPRHSASVPYIPLLSSGW